MILIFHFYEEMKLNAFNPKSAHSESEDHSGKTEVENRPQDVSLVMASASLRL